jgi:Na+-translocating ferredoxin:NAD+ oxidoreductase subunit C
LVPDMSAPVVKATNCLIAHSPALFPPNEPEMPCIRCGSCAEVCPHELQPFELYWHARSKNFDKVKSFYINDCIECGCCSFVCPSHIPLVQYFRFAKSEIWAQNQDKRNADEAKSRFEFKQYREERDKQEKAEKLAKAAAAQAAKKAAEAAAAASSGEAIVPVAIEADPKKAAIAAAMARAAAQRAPAIATPPATPLSE